MTFVELNFLIFIAVTALIFYICPVKFRWLVLLASSLVFYGIAGVKYFPFIFVTSFSVFLAGRGMGRIYENMDKTIAEGEYDRKEKKALKDAAKKKCKKILVLLLILNVGILAVIKFTRFAVGPLNSLFGLLGVDTHFNAAWIIVPLGISYYTFSSLSYLLDVYWKRVDYEKNYARFLLYAIYFPHILQGPIERYGKLGQRLKQELRFDYDRFCKGMQLIVWGFFKKLVIADRIDIFISGVYDDFRHTSGAMFLVAMILDVVYIYADFSGCMDIARGVSQMFGVELDLNFDHPFSAKSVTEFWRRWHMTLGGWFKDYVYYPISTSDLVKNIGKACKKKELPDWLARSLVTVIPVTVTWVLTGLWHGTGKTYLAWGIYYAFMIFMSVTFGDSFKTLGRKLNIKMDTWSFGVFQMIRTTCIFAGGRLLTRPGTLWLSKYALKTTFTDFKVWTLFDGTLYQYGLDEAGFRLAIIAILIFGIISILQLRGVSIRDSIGRQNIVFRWAVYLLAIFAVILYGIYGPGYDAASFVYMAY